LSQIRPNVCNFLKSVFAARIKVRTYCSVIVADETKLSVRRRCCRFFILQTITVSQEFDHCELSTTCSCKRCSPACCFRG